MLEHQLVVSKVRRSGRPVPGGDGGGHPHQELRHHRQRGRVLLLAAEHPHLAKITLTHLFDPRSLLLIMSSEINEVVKFYSYQHITFWLLYPATTILESVASMQRVSLFTVPAPAHIYQIFLSIKIQIFSALTVVVRAAELEAELVVDLDDETLAAVVDRHGSP